MKLKQEKVRRNVGDVDIDGDEGDYVGGDEDGDNHQQQVVTEDVNLPGPASNALMTNLS